MNTAASQNTQYDTNVVAEEPTAAKQVRFSEILEVSPACKTAWHYLGWTTESPVQALQDLQNVLSARQSADIVQQIMIVVRTFESIKTPEQVAPTTDCEPIIAEVTTESPSAIDEFDDAIFTVAADGVEAASEATESAAFSDIDELPIADIVPDADEPFPSDIVADEAPIACDCVGERSDVTSDVLDLAELLSTVDASQLPSEQSIALTHGNTHESLPVEEVADDSALECSANTSSTNAQSTVDPFANVSPSTTNPLETPAQPVASTTASDDRDEQQLLDWSRRVSSEVGNLLGRPAVENPLVDPVKPLEVSEGSTKRQVILAVDDSPTVRKLVSMTLELHGYQVETAEHGLDALKVLARVTPDLILLDVNMPRMDGYKLCKMIKGHAKTRDIPVIMLSGKDGMFDKLRGKFSGCNDYISKPFEASQLLAHIGRYLSPEEATT